MKYTSCLRFRGKIRELVAAISLSLHDDLPQDLVRPLEVVVDHDDVERARLGVLELADRGSETCRHGFGGLGSSPGQAGLERGDGRWRDEDVEGVEVRVVGLDQLDSLSETRSDNSKSAQGLDASHSSAWASGDGTNLGIDIEDAHLSALLDVLDGLHARAVHVAAKLGVFDKAIALDEVEKVVARDKVVRDAVRLAWPRCPSRVCS